MSREIDRNDIVDVYYCDGRILRDVRVLWTPRDVGDLWQLLDKDGNVIAQNPASANFDYIVKKPRKEGENNGCEVS